MSYFWYSNNALKFPISTCRFRVRFCVQLILFFFQCCLLIFKLQLLLLFLIFGCFLRVVFLGCVYFKSKWPPAIDLLEIKSILSSASSTRRRQQRQRRRQRSTSSLIYSELYSYFSVLRFAFVTFFSFDYISSFSPPSILQRFIVSHFMHYFIKYHIVMKSMILTFVVAMIRNGLSTMPPSHSVYNHLGL